jgi:pyrroloquinoline quinone (PQQ) biosynthesis protein C
MRASKEILANEIGVIFNKPGKDLGEVDDKDREGDPDIVSIEGSVDGGTFRFRAAHFEWLLRIGEVLGLGFNDMGKRRHGTPATLFFCDQLAAIYGNEDPNIAEGASFAVENWAAAGFWKQLVAGLDAFKKAEEPKLPLAFFTWHDRIEEQHAGHVMEELEELYFTEDFDEEKFIKGGREMLEGVQAFWTGLNENRLAAAATAS